MQFRLKHRDGKPFTLTLTSKGNLESPVTLTTCLLIEASLWEET